MGAVGAAGSGSETGGGADGGGRTFCAPTLRTTPLALCWNKCLRSNVPVAFWSRVVAEGQRRTWTPREEEAYGIVLALRKWAGYIALHHVSVCTDHQSLQLWHKRHMDTPSGPASRRARWHETLAKLDLTVVYVPGKDNTLADCLSRWAYPASKGMTDVSAHGDEAETAEAVRIIEMERLMEEEGVKCFVVMAAEPLPRKEDGQSGQSTRP